ncbi:ribosomal protein L36 [Hamiltosporidium tvaerminnensis]|uniref:Ribosomal protein L36 n=2 Tax=Hamiltosporidium TaxID=1176354 RepID=A0A4Q9LJ56_9MICR|nr:ribosomal protein L36 [Hamiltosporidium magnivora]TBU10880.1 ribosomal protein L36 [Hamiltosporidium tvaerminnensis]
MSKPNKTTSEQKKRKQKKEKTNHKVTPLTLERLPRPGKKTMLSTKNEKVLFARSIVTEICGLSPYEKKALEYLRKDKDRRCKKFLKSRLGTLRTAKKKLEALSSRL